MRVVHPARYFQPQSSRVRAEAEHLGVIIMDSNRGLRRPGREMRCAHTVDPAGSHSIHAVETIAKASGLDSRKEFFTGCQTARNGRLVDHELFGLDVARSKFCVTGTVPPAGRQQAAR